MSDLVPLAFAATLLAAVMGLTYRRWVARHWGELDAQQRGALSLVLLTLAGGFVGAFVWWTDDVRGFSWDLPPLASRMLAAAGWSFAVLCALALRRPTARRLRLVMLLLFVYLAPLAAAILAFHVDRFNFGQPIAYAFFIIVSVMTVAATWYLVRPCRPILADRMAEGGVDDAAPPAATAKSWLIAVAVVAGAWGTALFATDQGPSDLVWAWPGDLLTSRLIGVMLLTVAAACVYALASADIARVVLAMTTTYGLGLSAASLWNALAAKPVKPAYAVVFAVVALGSVAVLRMGAGGSSGQTQGRAAT